MTCNLLQIQLCKLDTLSCITHTVYRQPVQSVCQLPTTHRSLTATNICIQSSLFKSCNTASLVLGQFVAACKGSLRRLGMDQIGIGQLHWSTANYQPLQERALWDGLVALHDQVRPVLPLQLRACFFFLCGSQPYCCCCWLVMQNAW